MLKQDSINPPGEFSCNEYYLFPHPSRTKLHYAAFYGDIYNAERAILEGVNLDVADHEGNTALYYALLNDPHSKVVELLISRGADVNTANKKGETPLRRVIINGDITKAKLLILVGAANINITDKYGRTPLYNSVGGKCLEISELLINQGADVNILDTRGRTILHEAADRGDIEIAKILITKNLNINQVNNSGETPLLSALFCDKLNFAEFLVKQGADVNIENKKGESPLFLSVCAYNKKVFDILTKNIVCLNKKNEYDDSLLNRLNKRTCKIHHELKIHLGSISKEIIMLGTFLQEKCEKKLVSYMRNGPILDKLKFLKNNHSLMLYKFIEQQYKEAEKQELYINRISLIREIGLPDHIMEHIGYYLSECDKKNLITACLGSAKIAEQCSALSSNTASSNKNGSIISDYKCHKMSSMRFMVELLGSGL